MLIPLRRNTGSQRNLDFGIALTKAMNTWQVERWVKNEPRLRLQFSSRRKTPQLLSPKLTQGLAIPISRRYSFCRRPMSLLGAAATGRSLKRRYVTICRSPSTSVAPTVIHNGHPSTGGSWPSYYMEEHHRRTRRKPGHVRQSENRLHTRAGRSRAAYRARTGGVRDPISLTGTRPARNRFRSRMHWGLRMLSRPPIRLRHL